MGFYPPHVIASEARRCGIEIRPVDVEASDLLTTVEMVEGQAIRLGLAAVAGLGEGPGVGVGEAEGRISRASALASRIHRLSG